jgi:hypothetical protein
MAMRVPDFFIIGAPKCGTTALSEYLREHPSICFSHVKEPHFFSDDLPAYKIDETLNDYLRRNFSHFDPRRHGAMGEGSVYYYISEVAISNILKVQPSAKLIYAVRNPVDMAHSLHSQYRFNSMEDIEDFETAWDAQESRAAGRSIPRLCHEPRFLQYRAMAQIGHRLQMLKSIVPAKQLLVIVFDDLVRNTKQVYEDVLRFLEISSDGREVFPVINENKEQRSKIIGYLLASIPKRLHNAVREFKYTVSLSHVPLNLLAMINVKPAMRSPLPERVRSRLVAEFEPDLRLLETQLGRDLANWRT